MSLQNYRPWIAKDLAITKIEERLDDLAAANVLLAFQQTPILYKGLEAGTPSIINLGQYHWMRDPARPKTKMHPIPMSPNGDSPLHLLEFRSPTGMSGIPFHHLHNASPSTVASAVQDPKGYPFGNPPVVCLRFQVDVCGVLAPPIEIHSDSFGTSGKMGFTREMLLRSVLPLIQNFFKLSDKVLRQKAGTSNPDATEQFKRRFAQDVLTLRQAERLVLVGLVYSDARKVWIPAFAMA